MCPMRRIPTALLLAIAVSSVSAQAPLPLVTGSGNFFSPIVASLEKAVAFYRDGLGLEVMGEPSNADTNAPLRNMFGLPDAKLRWTVARPAGSRSGVEIIEIAGASGHPLDRTLVDPGAFTLVVTVTDLAATLTRLQAAGATVVTVGGGPVVLGGGQGRAVVVRDRDDHFVELVQPETPPAATTGRGGVVDVHVRLTVDNLDRALQLYRDALGLQLERPASAFAGDQTIRNLLGVRRGQYRYAFTTVPGSNLKIAFMEFKGIDRRRARATIQDPGSTRLQLQVRDLDAAIKAVVAAGGQIVSSGGVPVELPAGRGAPIRAAIVRDPNNLFLVLIGAQPARP
jgi:catechol 2,3-dioxygenase-like lactoylglutathione lyase family enzyme